MLNLRPKSFWKTLCDFCNLNTKQKTYTLSGLFIDFFFFHIKTKMILKGFEKGQA